MIGLERNERITEDAEAKMLEEAVQTSYRRGGEATSLTTDVSKQTVKNKIHKLKFPVNEEVPEKKKAEAIRLSEKNRHGELGKH